MRILFVIHDMVVGGAGKQLALTANGLSLKGHNVFVYTYCDNKLSHCLDKNIVYVPQKKMPRNKVTEYLFSVINVRKQMKSIRPDIVVSWRCNAGLFVNLASIGLDVKTVYSERNDPNNVTSLPIKIASFISEFSSGGVFQLESIRRYYKRLYAKSVVIPNPISVNNSVLSLSDYSKREKKIVNVGRMYVHQKRQDLMLEAFKIFLKKHSDYTLHFFGDGCDFEKIKQKSAEMKIVGNVVFHGAVRNVLDEIRNAKMLVLTSDFEGIPNVVLEAFAVGIPVVATDCSPGGARFLIEDGKNGFLAPVGDSETIANRMSDIVENEKIAEKFINQGRVRIADFEPNKIFDRWNDYLENLIRT